MSSFRDGSTQTVRNRDATGNDGYPCTIALRPHSALICRQFVDSDAKGIFMSVRPQTKDKPASVEFPVGRSVPARRAAHRRRAHDPRHRARLCAGQAAAARHQGLSRGEDRPRDLQRDGRTRPDRHHAAGGIWLRQCELRRLWPGGARDRARRFRLSLDELGAVVAGDAPDLRLWRREPAQEISAQARDRRMGRLLRPDRARCRLRSRRHEDPRREGVGRLPADRQQDVDFQRADRRRVRGVGEVGRA